ncbi:MAG: ATP-grasp domain-containing protein [Deltaproteobacteria bacterium]|nr:ATP-grasp domain-containing protein [Deltaproteobacteria bacterium]MBN2671375.1 ATP-grasp domain-containing protein [Deltaproteobacteria bacterium]
MCPPKTVVIVHNDVVGSDAPDELDVLEQVNAVSDALVTLDYAPVRLAVTLNLQATANLILKLKPHFVFNLFESVESTGRFIYFAPAVLDHLGVPYSGSSTREIFLTTHKVLSKEHLKANGLPTPRWTFVNKILTDLEEFPFPCIVKPIWEDASVGLDSASVFYDFDSLKKWADDQADNTSEMFIEEFVDGPEFNISILASPQGPEVLPPAEIKFVNFPSEMPRMVGYRAKWDADSFECQNTVRSFELSAHAAELVSAMTSIALQCWHKFNLRGYARVDFRVRKNGQPEVLEINANPCISPDSGFVAACEQAGVSYTAMIQRIVQDIHGLDSPGK